MNRSTIRRIVVSVILFVGLLTLFRQPLRHAVAQPVNVGLFYIISHNSNTFGTSLWEANSATNTAQNILNLNYLAVGTPNTLFPSRESSIIKAEASRGHIPSDWPSASRVVQALSEAYLLDQHRLLILTTNEVCDRIGSGNCFGYYEFLLFQKNTKKLTSLLKVDYHHIVVPSWVGCSSPIRISAILPNPTQDKFAFEFGPSRCLGLQQPSQGYVVDYSTASALVMEIPSGGGLSWSPDGTHLAYYSRQNCHDDVCNTVVQVRSPTPNATPVTVVQSSLPFSISLVTAWLDNRTVLCQWAVSSESPNKLLWYDIVTDGKGFTELGVQFLTNSMYYLRQGQQCHLLGINTDSDGTALGLPAQKTLTIEKSFSPANRVSYNSRFPSYLFLDQGIANQVLVIDAALNQSTLNLASFVTDPTETILSAIPGG